MTGEELKKIVEKNAIKKCESEYESSFHVFDWDAIAAEISPKPLKMEKLVDFLDISSVEGDFAIVQYTKDEPYIAITRFNINQLLDLINNKQKEQS